MNPNASMLHYSGKLYRSNSYAKKGQMTYIAHPPLRTCETNLHQPNKKKTNIKKSKQKGPKIAKPPLGGRDEGAVSRERLLAAGAVHAREQRLQKFPLI